VDGPGRSGGPAACPAGRVIEPRRSVRVDGPLAPLPGVVYSGSIENEEATKVSRVIKRVSYGGVAVAVLCGVAACASGPSQTDAQAQADKVMAERVEAALNADKSLFAKHITAHADNGVVRLTGYVWETTDFEEAVFVAQGVPGVTKVVNDLELNRNGNDAGPVSY
jgi:osmotically-inducible protein OsmY